MNDAMDGAVMPEPAPAAGVDSACEAAPPADAPVAETTTTTPPSGVATLPVEVPATPAEVPAPPAEVPAPPADPGTPATADATVPRPSLRAWLRDHDEQWPFIVAYLGASIVLSIMISLFWLIVMIAVHFIFECVRQSHYREGRSNVLLHALWEVKLDIGLAALAFAVVLYIDVILGALGLQSAARVAAATRVGARAAAWERNLRTFLLTVDEITRVSHAAYTLGARRLRRTPSVATSHATTVHAPDVSTPAWQLRWGWADRIGVVLVTGGVGMILLTPLLTPHDLASAAALILEQLRPFPS